MPQVPLIPPPSSPLHLLVALTPDLQPLPRLPTLPEGAPSCQGYEARASYFPAAAPLPVDGQVEHIA